MLTHHTAFDPETVTLLTEVLDRAAAAIPGAQRSNECKSRLHRIFSAQPRPANAIQSGCMQLHLQSVPENELTRLQTPSR